MSGLKLDMFWQDCEIDGLNEQLEEDCMTIEQLQQERATHLDAKQENVWLHVQVCILINILNDDDGEDVRTT